MRNYYQFLQYILFGCVILMLKGCAYPSDTTTETTMRQSTLGVPEEVADKLPSYQGEPPFSSSFNEDKFASALPQNINLGHEKVIVVDPKKFAWGAYDANGTLVRGG